MVGLNYVASLTHASESTWPILICLLGRFRVLTAGRPAAVQGAKAEALLHYLGLQHNQHAPRDLLLETLWPDHPPALAGQSLNSLVYSLRKSLSDEIHGEPPVLCRDGYYRLNKEAGVNVDILYFEDLINRGDQHMLANSPITAIGFYIRAVQLYRGDLCTGADINTVVARERLRAHLLTVRASLADHYFSVDDYARCLHYAERLLLYDPCREDAHRLVMRCYVRRGERAQALRQYRLCQNVLRAEFDVAPELLTTVLFDEVRLDPDNI